VLQRLAGRLPRLTLVITLLVLTLGVASALAWQAHQAARSHREAAERVLHDYVAFAGWEFSRASRRELEASLDRWLDVIGCAALDGSLPEPAGLASRSGCKCHDLDARSLFAVDLDTGQLTSTGAPLGDDARRWIVQAAQRPADHAAIHRSRLVRVDVVDGRAHVIAARLLEQRGTAVALSGFVAEPAVFTPAFANVLTRAPLLPPTLAGSGNEMLGVVVTTRTGAPVFSTPDTAGTSVFRGTLDEALGGLAFQVSLVPAAADRLVIGGLPRSRLPVLLGLLGLTAGLVVVAVLQLRREHDLAGLRADFVSSISHELRTPLAQIRLFSETLLLGRVRSEAEGRRSLEIIQQESRRLAHLVENVLYFSRSERGSQRLSPVRSRLAGLAEEVIETFAPLARSARATLRVVVRDDVDAPVDPGALRQILLNLLDNAVKYGPPGQTVTVTIDRRGGEALLLVDDQGPGVPADVRERIWRPYSRLASAAASAVAGTGIGLAVVRDLVVLHGGSTGVEDAPGGGARFVIALPGAIAHGAEAVSPAAQQSSATA
jgi:signal transduction histidine kinase